MTVSSVGEWRERLRSNQSTGFDSEYPESPSPQDLQNKPFFHRDEVDSLYKAGNTYAGGEFERWPEGYEYSFWQYDWNFIENYLQYGGKITIFSALEGDTDSNYSELSERAKNKKIPIDAFVSQFFTQNDLIRSIVNYRQDCIAITSVPSEYKGGSGFGRNQPIDPEDPEEGLPPADPRDMFQFFSGITFSFTGPTFGYDPVASNVRPFLLDNVYLKNTGDYEYPSGRPVFSCHFYDKRPYNGRYGSTSEFIEAYREDIAPDKLRSVVNIIGQTFDNNLMSGVNGVTGFTLFGGISASFAVSAGSFEAEFTDNGPARQINGRLMYFDGNDYLQTDIAEDLNVSKSFWSSENPEIVEIRERFETNSRGITYFANTKSKLSPGRVMVTTGLLPITTSFSPYRLSRNYTVMNGDYTAVLDRTDFYDNVALPPNYKDKFSYHVDLVGAPFSGGARIGLCRFIRDSYPQYDGKHTYLFAGSENSRSNNFPIKMVDVRASLDPEFDLSNELYGPDGFINLPEKKQKFDYLWGNETLPGLGGASAAISAWKKQNNIYGSEPPNIIDGSTVPGNLAIQYWGCTCGNDDRGPGAPLGLREFIFDITGTKPDICIDFGPKSTTRDVTAEGSTYRAYIGYSSYFPETRVASPVNIFGEYLGSMQLGQIGGGGGGGNEGEIYPWSEGGSTASLFVSKWEFVPGGFFLLNTGGRTNIPVVWQNQNVKGLRLRPLVTDLTESGFALTADSDNFIYSLIHFPGPQASIGSYGLYDNLISPNYPFRLVKDSSPVYNLGNIDGTGFNLYAERGPDIFQKFGGENAIVANSIIGMKNPSNIGSTGVYSFFGTAGTTYDANASLDGYTADGIYFLAELSENAWDPVIHSLVPPDVLDPEDFTYSNIFSSNADLYEFPVFGEKFCHNSFTEYRSEEDLNTISSANEVPFTSDVSGIFARQFRDLKPWSSPANQSVSSITDIIRERYHLSNQEQDDLYDDKINFIKNLDGSLRLFGDKTFTDSTSTFSRINVANLFIYLKKKLEPMARQFLFEENDSQSRELFKSSVEPFLRTLKGQRAISDFKLICDETNNTPDVIDSNQFLVEILIKPTKTINFIKLTLNNVGTSFELE